MRDMRFAAAALAIAGLAFLAGCLKDESEPSLVSEAHAGAPSQKDFGWRTTPTYPAEQKDAVYEYQ